MAGAYGLNGTRFFVEEKDGSNVSGLVPAGICREIGEQLTGQGPLRSYVSRHGHQEPNVHNKCYENIRFRPIDN